MTESELQTRISVSICQMPRKSTAEGHGDGLQFDPLPRKKPWAVVHAASVRTWQVPP